jgi:hypothetical protein
MNNDQKMKKIRVRCTFELDLEVPWEEEDGYDATFDIEENHCPCTGYVGAAFNAHLKRCEAESVCWACPTGTNEIIYDEQYEQR